MPARTRPSRCSPASPSGARWRRSSAATRSSVYVATTALQDPHQIQARPSLIARGAQRRPAWSAPAPSSRSAGCRCCIRQSGNDEDPARQAGQLRGRGLRAASSRCRRGSTAPRATCTRPATRTSRPIRATSRSSPTRWRGVWPRSMRPTRRATAQRAADFAARWQAAIARWEQQAAPLRGTQRRGPAQGLCLPRATGSACRRSAALEPKPGVEPTSSHLSEVLEGLKSRPAKMIVRAAYKDGRGRRMARRTHPAAGRRAALHRRRRRQGAATCSACSTTPSSAWSRPLRHERRHHGLEHPAARASSPGCWCSPRTCRSARRCSSAASSSSTSPSRRSPASA